MTDVWVWDDSRPSDAYQSLRAEIEVDRIRIRNEIDEHSRELQEEIQREKERIRLFIDETRAHLVQEIEGFRRESELTFTGTATDPDNTLSFNLDAEIRRRSEQIEGRLDAEIRRRSEQIEGRLVAAYHQNRADTYAYSPWASAQEQVNLEHEERVNWKKEGF